MFFKNQRVKTVLLLIVFSMFFYTTISFAPHTVVEPRRDSIGDLVGTLNALRAQSVAIKQIQEEMSPEQVGGRMMSSQFLGKVLVTWKEKFWSGSVALVDYEGEKYFLTAGHVFSYNVYGISFSVKDLRVIISIQGRIFEYNENNFVKDFAEDFAFMPAPKNLKTDLFLYNDVELNNQSKLVSFGFPLNNFFVSSGSFIKQTDKAVVHSCLLTKGSSGGPLVFVDGAMKKFIGINVLANALEEGSTEPLAVSYKLILKAIKTQKSN